METLEETLKQTCDWAIDRIHHHLIHHLCGDSTKETLFNSVENAYCIHEEFSEWLNPNSPEQKIISLEYIGDDE
jgi:hypothetical protein